MRSGVSYLVVSKNSGFLNSKKRSRSDFLQKKKAIFCLPPVLAKNVRKIAGKGKTPFIFCDIEAGCLSNRDLMKLVEDLASLKDRNQAIQFHFGGCV